MARFQIRLARSIAHPPLSKIPSINFQFYMQHLGWGKNLNIALLVYYLYTFIYSRVLKNSMRRWNGGRRSASCRPRARGTQRASPVMMFLPAALEVKFFRVSSSALSPPSSVLLPTLAALYSLFHFDSSRLQCK